MKKSILFIFFGCTIVLLCFSVISFSAGIREKPDNTNILAANLIVIIILALLMTAQTTYFLLQLRSSRQNNELKFKYLLDNYLSRLNTAVSEFSRGNLGVAVNTKKYTPPEGSSSQLYNSIETILTDTITDFNNVTSTPLGRLCYVGADSFLEGQKCGTIMGELIDGGGDVLILIHSLANVGQYLRRKGFIKALHSANPGLNILASEEGFEDSDKSYSITLNYINEHRDLKGIYITEGSTPHAVAKALEASGRQRDVVVVCHDLARETAEYIKKGIIHATLSQSPYVQGYNPLIYMYNYLISNEAPFVSRYHTDLEEINRDNLSLHWDDSRKKQVLSELATKKLALVEDNPGNKSFRIAILIPDEKYFWEPVVQGAYEGAAELRRKNINVDIIIPDETREGDFSAACIQRNIEKLLGKNYSGLCLPVFSQELTGYLNTLVAKGLTIITYNAEPFNLRSIIDTVIHATRRLLYSSENIDASTNESMETGNQTEKIAGVGHQSVMQSNSAIEEAQQSMEYTSEITRKLNERIENIKEISSLINEMASRTNTISLNASILAARAGENGRAFSVVANEIRALAEKSINRSSEITDIITWILDNVNELTSMIGKSMESVNKSTAMSHKAGSVLSDIIDITALNQEKIQAIKNSVQEMISVSQNVQESMKKLEEYNQN